MDILLNELYHIFLIVDLLDFGIRRDHLLYLSHAVFGSIFGIELNLYRGEEWVVSDEANEIFAKFFGEIFGGLFLIEVDDRLDEWCSGEQFLDFLDFSVLSVVFEHDGKSEILLNVCGETVGIEHKKPNHTKQKKNQRYTNRCSKI